MNDKPKTWDELERMAGIKRTVAPRPTQNDVAELTRRRLARSPFWRRRRRQA